MKRLLVAGAIAAALILPGHAANLPIKAPLPTPAPADLFTGWWLMGEVGYSDGSAKVDPSLGIPKIKPAGFIGGVGILARTRLSAGIYLGLASTFDFSGETKTVSDGFGDSIKAKLTSVGRTTVQAGMLLTPNLLAYVDGGVAYGRTSGLLTMSGGSMKVSDTSAGYTFGAGVDYALTSSAVTAPLLSMSGTTVGFEYAYVDLGKADYCIACGPVGAGVQAKIKDNLFLVNFKYKFGS
jgi:outer membrane immunogenic protein